MTITGIILAGGNSSRMGTDKGFVKLKDKNLVKHVIDTLNQVTDDIIIIANNSEYRCFGYTVFSDIIKNSGPMGGIYSGLIHSHSENNLVLSCDTPFITSNLLRFIIKNSKENDITLPIHNNKIEPLCGVYKKDCSGKLKELLLKKEFKMMDALKKFKIKTIEVSMEKKFSDKLFQNINSKSELLQADEMYDEN